MKLIEDIVNQGHGSLSPTYLFVHSTASPGATAKNHRDLYSRGEWPYVVQYVSDWTGVVYHTMPDNRLAWAVGKGNKYGINIEICEGTTQDQFNRTWSTAVDFCAYRLIRNKWSIDNMLSHDECRVKWGGTDHTDPVPYFKKYGKTWQDFKNAVAAKMKEGVWVEDYKGWWWLNPDGSWPKSGWSKKDAWYYFNENGYALAEKWVYYKNQWYWLNKSCRMVKGWNKIGGKWYYMEKTTTDKKFKEGAAHTGWLKLNGDTFYFNEKSDGTECVMREGWFTKNGKKYYFRPDGDGRMVANGTYTIDGKSYKFDANGVLV